jgi:hypothetical protein
MVLALAQRIDLVSNIRGEVKMAFDGRCYELAQAALSDEEHLNREDMRYLLAQHIQTSIEKWIMMERDITSGHSTIMEPAAIRIAELRAEVARLQERIRELGNAQKSRFFNAREGRGDLDRLEAENARLRAALLGLETILQSALFQSQLRLPSEPPVL